MSRRARRCGGLWRVWNCRAASAAGTRRPRASRALADPPRPSNPPTHSGGAATAGAPRRRPEHGPARVALRRARGPPRPAPRGRGRATLPVVLYPGSPRMGQRAAPTPGWPGFRGRSVHFLATKACETRPQLGFARAVTRSNWQCAPWRSTAPPRQSCWALVEACAGCSVGGFSGITAPLVYLGEPTSQRPGVRVDRAPRTIPCFVKPHRPSRARWPAQSPGRAPPIREREGDTAWNTARPVAPPTRAPMTPSVPPTPPSRGRPTPPRVVGLRRRSIPSGIRRRPM
jgi:hypothetical protein